MSRIKPKKSLGQHFLINDNIAFDICNALPATEGAIIEIGAGTGALTKHLFKKFDIPIYLNEIDTRSISFLRNEFPQAKEIIETSFLDYNLQQIDEGPLHVIGNFPYNISSQIMFHILDHREIVNSAVGMFQKEVAQRLCAQPSKKHYGILSVLLEAYYKREYLFDVDKNEFNPPPKVQSGVVRFTRNNTSKLPCNEKKFRQIVKAAFHLRRKKLRNALKSLFNEAQLKQDIFDKRAEQLSLDEFVGLAQLLE